MKHTVSGKRCHCGAFPLWASRLRPVTRSLAAVGLAICLAAQVMAAGRYQAPAARRTAQTVNREWTFNYFPAENADSAGCQAPDFDDSAWSAVAVPHTWSTYETTGEVHPYIHNAGEKNSTYWWYGWGWYRKHFVIAKAQAGGKVFVEFDGVQKYCKVWLNGHYVGDHKGGFHSFYFDLTDHVRFGEDNMLVVAVNNRQTDPFHIPVMDAGIRGEPAKPTPQSVTQDMLLNIKENGFNGDRRINGGLGGLWINWRTDTKPLQVNFNGSGSPDASKWPRLVSTQTQRPAGRQCRRGHHGGDGLGHDGTLFPQ